MSLQQFVNAFATEASQEYLPVVGLLKSKNASLLDLIKASQLFITNNSVNVRSRAFLLLSKVLDDLPRGLLYEKDIVVLINFFISKFNDDPLVLTNVFNSLIPLVLMDQYTPNDNLLNEFINNYNPRQYTALIRVLPLKLAINLPNIQSHPSFIKFFLCISQNEKDPKNLMLLFEIIDRITSSDIDISDNVNELFDCIFKYYPISFKSSNDTQLIQINSLKKALNKALASSDLFANDLFINLIDKFNTTSSPSTKLDILDTIKTVTLTLSTNIMENHFIQLWNTLKYEILNFDLAQIIGQKSILQYYLGSSNDNDIVFGKTLNVLKLLFEKIESEDLLILVYDDLKKNLNLSEQQQQQQSNKFNQSCLILSLIVNQSIIDQTLFSMVNQDFDRISSKKQILVALTYFSNLNQSNFLKYQTEIFAILHSSLCVSDEESTLIAMACQSTVQFLLIQDFLIDERQFLLNILSDLLINSKANSIVNKTIIESISKLGTFSQFDDLLLNEIFNPLLIKARNGDISSLDSIVELISTTSLVNSLTIRLLNSTSINEIPIVNVLNTVYKLLIKLPLDSPLDQFTKFVSTLYEIPRNDDDMITFYIGLILRRLSISISETNLEKLLNECNDLTFKLFIIQSLPKDNKSLNFLQLLKETINNLPPKGILKLVYLSSCCNIVNKYLNWDSISQFIESPNNNDLKIWLIRGLVLKNDSNAIEYIVKLLNEGSNLDNCKTILRILFQEIPENDINLDISLEVIYRKKKANSGIIGFNNFAIPIINWIVRPVWKQRLFQMIKDDSKANSKSNSEIMILLLMKLPEDIYNHEMESIIPMLMKSLQINDIDVSIGVFKIISEIIKANGGDKLKIHIDSIFERCMNLLKSNNNNNNLSIELKMVLWVFLRTLTGFKHTNVIAPFKDVIIKQCSISMMEVNSRNVRMEIVECRQKWEIWNGSLADMTPHDGGDHHGHFH